MAHSSHPSFTHSISPNFSVMWELEIVNPSSNNANWQQRRPNNFIPRIYFSSIIIWLWQCRSSHKHTQTIAYTKIPYTLRIFGNDELGDSDDLTHTRIFARNANYNNSHFSIYRIWWIRIIEFLYVPYDIGGNRHTKMEKHMQDRKRRPRFICFIVARTSFRCLGVFSSSLTNRDMELHIAYVMFEL